MSAVSVSRRGHVAWLTGDPKHGPLPAMLVGLTALTGVVDAVSILALGRVFVANMTGNVVFVAFAVAGAAGFSLAASLSALAGFVVGARFAGRLIGRYGGDRARLFAAGCRAELVVVAVALAVTTTAGSGLTAVGQDAVAALLAVGTGMQNGVARRLAVPDMTTTVLTMTLTGLAAESTVKRDIALGRRLLAVSSMLIGAVAGAELVLNVSVATALAVATCLLAVVTVAAAMTARRPASWRTPDTNGARHEMGNSR
jgi:uncharacterized membrane protein YoaK (UPF0700 family)